MVYYIKDIDALLDDAKYEEAMKELRNRIPATEVKQILSQPYCELDETFFGFAHVYRYIRDVYQIPKDYVILDFGCNLAPQSYLFQAYCGYIGIDRDDQRRFQPANTVHFQMSIAEFLAGDMAELQKGKCFAICSAVPGEEVRELVWRTFPNAAVYYPGTGLKVKFDFQ